MRFRFRATRLISAPGSHHSPSRFSRRGEKRSQPRRWRNTRKSLSTLSISESSRRTRGLSKTSSAIFTRASRWDAVLLLDEADVLLEKRSYEDLHRNGIVSGKKGSRCDPKLINADCSCLEVFLRMLEYYEGILFLTTNQPRHYGYGIPVRAYKLPSATLISPQRPGARFGRSSSSD